MFQLPNPYFFVGPPVDVRGAPPNFVVDDVVVTVVVVDVVVTAFAPPITLLLPPAPPLARRGRARAAAVGTATPAPPLADPITPKDPTRPSWTL